MKKKIIIFFAISLFLFLVDQAIKYQIIAIANPQDLDGFTMILDMPVISIALVFNTGVAFSFLSELGEWLKYIQIVFIIIIFGILITQKQLFKEHYIPFAIMLGGGVSNVLDRFLHGGVVDYIYWHYGFDFPIFNFADVIIDCGIAIFIWQVIFSKKIKQK
ncbi:lipoprotein signal peptidase [Helicobacter didelphidarum]|uniref:Lipoprotein signal peptidase n=1 Tax=Helicobacter didelphidarum TaxID=2040648 RepID=A0A3D8IKU8_9HELI|nr:signal peptidase II [Helicobacter didelphidarum]RDU65808.1 lipoprotein signal peptidase [Helicobacter didelphidarum]